MILSLLLTSWVLSWFGFDKLFIQAIKELFKKEVTIASYYFVFFCVGTIGELVLFFNGHYAVHLFN